MRFLDSAWHSWGQESHGEAETSNHDLEVVLKGPGSEAWQTLRRRGAATSFIRRCWYPERGCDESSTCADLRQLWEGVREDVKVLPPKEECGRPQYIVTGTSRTSRNGVMDENRLDTLVFPGEKWHKCCVIPGKETPLGPGKPSFKCEHLKEVDRQKLQREMKGWCGPHKCVNPRDRCLIVDSVKEEGFKAKHKGECPMSCSGQCDKLTQKFECIYIGNEPPYGREGSETPQKMFNESEQYDVFALQTEDTSGDAKPEKNMEGEETGAEKPAESCAPLAAALLLPPPMARRGTTRRQYWSSFLS